MNILTYNDYIELLKEELDEYFALEDIEVWNSIYKNFFKNKSDVVITIRYLIIKYSEFKDFPNKILKIIYNISDDRDIIFYYIEKIFFQYFDDISIYNHRYETINRLLYNISNKSNENLKIQKLFIANISHEMRTLLNSIIGYLDASRDSNNIDEIKNYIYKSLLGSKNLLNLSNNILDVNKIHADELEIIPEYFYIDNMLYDILDIIEYIRLDKKSRVDFRFKWDIFENRIYSDRYRIQSILINLINNAFKYTPKGSIYFEVVKRVISDEEIIIDFIIKDTGIGIDEESKKHIFKPFYRTNTHIQGTGLGLYITKTIINKLNAKISFDSQKNRGSYFLVSIPTKIEKIDIKNITQDTICFYIDKKEYDKKIDDLIFTLKGYGMHTVVFRNERHLITYLLNSKKKPLKYLIIDIYKDNIERIDSLISFIKIDPQYYSTKFILINSPMNIKYKFRNFDYTFEYLPKMELFFKSNISNDILNSTLDKEINILLVDDLKSNLEILKLYITKIDAKVNIDTVLNAEDAIELCKKNSYDIILLDLKMPDIDGFELQKKLIENGVESKIYAISADIYDETIQRVFEAGFDGILKKPINLENLRKVLEEI